MVAGPAKDLLLLLLLLEMECAFLIMFAVVKAVNSEQRRTEDVYASKGEPSPSECLTASSPCFYGCAGQGGGSSTAP